MTDIWTVRIAFAWTGPRDALDALRDYGPLYRHRGRYVWTLPMYGDPGPGTLAERSGRVAWMAQDVLAAVLGGRIGDEDPAVFFVHRSTRCVPAERPDWARGVRAARDRHRWEVVRDGWPGRSRAMAIHRRRRVLRGRR